MIGWDKGVPFLYGLIMNKYALEIESSFGHNISAGGCFHYQCIGESPYIQIVLKTQV